MGKELASQSFIGWLGEDKYKKMVNFILHYLADIDIPVKRYVVLSALSFTLNLQQWKHVSRGTFIEFRNGMINVSPIGRNATYVSPSFLSEPARLKCAFQYRRAPCLQRL